MSRTFDPFDELAAMFLTTPQASGVQEAARVTPSRVAAPQTTTMNPSNGAASAAPAGIELLIAGHLPVRGGLWLTPYADAVARTSGTVGLIRLDGEEAMLQLVDHVGDGQPHDYPTLEQAILAQGDLVGTWIIRTGGGTPWPELAAAPVDRFTILTSADEAAIVAAYQMIKDLAEASLQINRKLGSVGLAIVGVDHAAAKAAIERLNRTTRSFLEVEVKLAICLPRIDTGIKASRCMLFAAEAVPSLEAVLKWTHQAKSLPRRREADQHSIAGKLYADRDANVLHASDVLRSPPHHQSQHPQRSPQFAPPFIPLKPGLPLPQPAAVPKPIAPRKLADATVDTAVDSPSAPIAPRAPLMPPMPPLPIPQARVVESSQQPEVIVETPREFQSAPIKLAPKPSAQVEAKHPVKPIEPDAHGQPVALSSFVSNLTTLPIRCPNHERIEMAVDRDGRLHLLGRESSLRDLQVVEAWTKSHREIIAMACPQHPINHLHRTVCHVFTAEPASLADLHGSSLRLHVLAPVVVNGQTGWYAAALNK